MTELTCDNLSQIMRDALEAVKKRGQAQLGDKAMVDAFEPAVEVMEENRDSLEEMLRKTGAVASNDWCDSPSYFAFL